MTARTRRQLLLAVLVVSLLVLAWLVVRAVGGPATPTTPSAEPTSVSARTAGGGGPAPTPGSTDPDSGLPWVAESALPPEAATTLRLIRAGGPFPYPRSDNQTFGNREGLLPSERRGYYREFTVETPGEDDRGARRVITGSGGEKYWTDDHYASFSRIREGS